MPTSSLFDSIVMQRHHGTYLSRGTLFNEAGRQRRSQEWLPKIHNATSKIRRREFIGRFTLAVKRLRGRRIDRRPIVVESKQQARLIARHGRLQPLERVLRYKERPFHRAVMAQNRTARRVGSKTRLRFGKLSMVR